MILNPVPSRMMFRQARCYIPDMGQGASKGCDAGTPENLQQRLPEAILVMLLMAMTLINFQVGFSFSSFSFQTLSSQHNEILNFSSWWKEEMHYLVSKSHLQPQG